MGGSRPPCWRLLGADVHRRRPRRRGLQPRCRGPRIVSGDTRHRLTAFRLTHRLRRPRLRVALSSGRSSTECKAVSFKKYDSA